MQKSESIIEEPIRAITDRINITNSNIVLTGVNSSGKTLVLKKLISDHKLKNDEYLFFENCRDFSIKRASYNNLIHYLEISIVNRLCWNLLHEDIESRCLIGKIALALGVETNITSKDLYSVLNDREKRDALIEERGEVFIDAVIKGAYDKISRYIIDGYNQKSLLSLTFGEISKPVIEILRSSGKRVNIIFNLFENGGPAEVQTFLLKYSTLFDRTIISIDKDALGEHDKDFEALGYKIIETNYTRDINFIRQYFNLRFQLEYAKILADLLSKVGYPAHINIIDYISEEDMQEIVKECNGDLEYIDRIVKDIINQIDLNGYKRWHANKESVKCSINDAIRKYNSQKNYDGRCGSQKALTLFTSHNQ